MVHRRGKCEEWWVRGVWCVGGVRVMSVVCGRVMVTSDGGSQIQLNFTN